MKVVQSRLTPCDPMDYTDHGILQARILEWVAIPFIYMYYKKEKVTQSYLTLCSPMDCPWNSPGQNSGVGSLSLLQGIFPTQGLNPGLLHCRQILYQLSHKRSPRTLQWVACPFCSRSAFLTQESNRGLLHGRRILHQLSYQGSPVLRPAIHCRITLISLHGIKVATC